MPCAPVGVHGLCGWMTMPTESSYEARPEYAWLRAFKRQHGAELMRRHGAHAIGIGRKKVAGEKTDRLALVFYVARKGEREGDPVPPTFSFTPEGHEEPVTLDSDVVEAPPAEFETTE